MADTDDTVSLAPEVPGDPSVPPRVGPYRVLDRIAHGGMGEVLAVADHRFDRELALKRIDPWPCHPWVLEAFETELRVTSRLQHPAIVPVYDHGAEDDGRPFFVMPRIRGETLAAVLSRNAPSLEERLEIFGKICDATAYAHRRGVLHLDLKPGNVLVAEGRAVYVLDWGIAYDGGGEHPPGMGTPRYMAPEQLTGNPDHLGVHTDVFGLGALLAAIATLHPPRWSEDGTLRWPDEAHDVPLRLRGICTRATARDPADRHPDVDALLVEVRQLFSMRTRVVLVRRWVPPGREQVFEDWVRGVIEVASRFPGHLGGTLLRGSVHARGREYLLIVRFASQEALERWDRSPERDVWVEAADRISGPAERADGSGNDAWFDVGLRC